MFKRLGLRYIWVLLLLPVTLLLQWLCSNYPQFTENIYSRGIFPLLSGIIAPVFGLLTFSMAELIVVLLAVLLIAFVVRGILHLRRIRFRGIIRGALKLAVIAATALFLFNIMWGLNYYREPLYKNLGYVNGDVNKADLAAVTGEEVAAINKLSPLLLYDKAGLTYYEGGFTAMRKEVNVGYTLLRSDKIVGTLIDNVKSSPKGVIPSQLMSYTGIEGIFIPFTYEPSINTDCPDFVLPFNISHETAHLKGFAREDEANFIAYLASCQNPDKYYQYSGHMSALMYLSNALYATDQNLWKQEFAQLDKRAAADFNNYNDFLTKHQGKVSDAAEKINDNYLKSQGQTQGVISYDMFVNLLVSRFATQRAR
jgi:hypothetical protein